MDDPYAGSDRQHRTWRDLPPTPPIDWPAAPAAAVAMPTAAPLAAPRPWPIKRMAIVGALVAVVTVVGAGLLVAGPQLNELLTAATPGEQAVVGDPTDEPMADTAAKLLPSVVQIETGGAMGSGFVAAEKGLILTASHVVGQSKDVTLRLHDGSQVSGAVVAVDRTVDTAVIRAEREDLPALKLGALADVRVGQTAIAGSPFGFSQTVTTGIISALGRTVPTPMGELHDLIQTDAAINSGNSGGPLADREGRAIGINTAIASGSGGSDGVGFAVPIDHAKAILDRVIDGSWTAANDKPADDPSLLGGLGDMFGPGGPLGDLFGEDGLGDMFGPDGLLGPDALGDLFGPDGGGTVPDPGLDDLMPLLDDLLRLLDPDLTVPEPQPTPDATPSPAPDEPSGSNDTDALDRLMDRLLDELLGPGGLSGSGTTPSSAGGTTR